MSRLTSAWSFSRGIHSPGPQRSESTVATDDTTSFSSKCRSCWLSLSRSALDLPSPFFSARTKDKIRQWISTTIANKRCKKEEKDCPCKYMKNRDHLCMIRFFVHFPFFRMGFEDKNKLLFCNNVYQINPINLSQHLKSEVQWQWKSTSKILVKNRYHILMDTWHNPARHH